MDAAPHNNEAHKNAQRLVHWLAVVVMFADGQLEIPMQVLRTMPKGLRLVEHYDAEKDAVILRVGLPAFGSDGEPIQYEGPALADAPKVSASGELPSDVPPVDVTGEPIESE